MPSQPTAAIDSDTDSTPATPADPPRGDGLDLAFAVCFSAIGVWSWVAVLAAEAGVFHAWTLVGIGAPLSVVAAAWTWRASRPAGRVSVAPLSLAGAAVVIALAGWLGTRPGEYLVDGSDGSVYLNIGRSLARNHALVAPDPVLATIPPSAWDAVLGREAIAPRLFNLFPGGIQVYPGVNAVEPNFFHLLPVWIGVATLLGGAHAAYFVSPLFGVIAAAAFWLLVRRFGSALLASATAVLLLVNYAQIWFMRVPTTEVMAQAFVLSGLYFTAVTDRRGEPVASALGAFAFGLAAFVRIDVLFFVTPIVVCCLGLAALERRWTRAWTWYALTLAALTLHALTHAAIWSRPYSERIIHHMFYGRSVSLTSRLLPPLILLLGVGALIAAWRFRNRALVRRTATVLFIAALVGAIVRIWPPLMAGYLPMLMSPLGLAMAVAGSIVLLREDPSPPSWLVVGLLLASALVYGESVRDRGALPLVLRRFVPVILPVSLLAAGVFIDRLWRGGAIAKVAAAACWAALLSIFVMHSQPLVAMPAMAGVHEEVANIAAALPPDAVVVIDKTTPSHLGLSLRDTFGRDVLWVSVTDRTGPVLAQMAARARRPIVVVRAESAGEAGALSARDLTGFALAPLRTVSLRTRQIEATIDRLPSRLVDRTAVLELYAGRPRPSARLPLTVEIGTGDLAGRLRGFYDAEQMGTATARWTRDAAEIQLPRVAGTPSGLSLRLAAPRGPAATRPTVTAALDGVAIGTTPPIGPEFEVVEVPLDQASRDRLMSGPAVVRLSVQTFVPAEAGMGADTRRLGAVVDWVRVNTR